MATTAQRIKEALIIRNMKQADLVEKTKIGKSSISTYISGSYEPKQKNLYKIAKALNVNEAWLMGYDVPMDSKVTPDQAWDEETQRFNDKTNAFYYQLKGLGWSYDWSPDENLYTFSNKNISIKVTADEYSELVEETENFCRKRLQKLLWKSLDLAPIAANNDNALDPEQQQLMGEDIDSIKGNEW